MDPSRRPGPIAGACIVLALATLAPAAHADDLPKADAPRIAPEADAVLRRMADHFAKLRSFRVEDVRTSWIGPIPLTDTRSVAFERPNRFACVTRSSLFASEGIDAVSDGRALTVLVRPSGTYARATAPAAIVHAGNEHDDLAIYLIRDLQEEDFLVDLMAVEPYLLLKAGTREATYEGLEGEEGARTHHLRLRRYNNYQVHLWVDAEGDPLPRRATSRLIFNEEVAAMVGRPDPLEFTRSFRFRWWRANTDEASLFAIKPPATFREVASIPEVMGYDKPDESRRTRPWVVGRPAPAFRRPELGGGTFDLAEHRGEVVLLNFWSTCFEPCTEELRIVAEVAKEFRPKGATYRGINLGDREARIVEFQREQGLAFPVVLGTDGVMASSDEMDQLSMTALVDRGGVVRLIHRGFVADLKAKLTAELDALLAGRDPAAGPIEKP